MYAEWLTVPTERVSTAYMMPVHFLDRRKDLDSQTCKDSYDSLFRVVVYLTVIVF